MQLDLFSHAASAYADAPNGRLSNAEFYRAVAERANIEPSELQKKAAIGQDGKEYLTLAHVLCVFRRT